MAKRLRRAGGLVSVVTIALALSAAAVGQIFDGAEDLSSNEPAVITADELIYNERTNLVTARGRVEISQGARLLRADEVTYDRTTQIVTATGNVILAEPNGDVFFADRAEVTDDLRDGFVSRVAVLLADHSRLAGSSATRESGEITILRDAVYSACEACEEDPERPLLWQIRAETVTHDGVARDIIYENAVLEFFGLPVLYTPYFSHPDPTVERRSGFLSPTLGTSSVIGAFATARYYLDIAPNQDATFRVTGSENAGLVLGGEYRLRLDRGLIVFDGSINRSDESMSTSSAGTEGDDWRGHIFVQGLYEWNEHWRSGADIRWASDDLYLETFGISDDEVLQSRVWTEGFYGLSYISAEAYTFQDLRRRKASSPTILPWVNGNYMGEPGDAIFGGQWFANASLINLWRDEAASVAEPYAALDTQRVSLQVGWQREIYTDFGLVVTTRASVRGDLYYSDELPGPGGTLPTRDDVFSGRLYPVASAIARYPLVGTVDLPWGQYQQLIEPIVGVTVSPTIDPSADIPNNDSADPEFDEINLFSDNRFPGLDRVEGGSRITYGARWGLFGSDGTSATVFLGQSFRFQEDDSFTQSSGLYDQFSDIVGRVTLKPHAWLDLDWRFRFDNEELANRRQTVVASVGPADFRLSTAYTFLATEGSDDLLTDQEQIRLGFTARIDDYWSAAGSLNYDITEEELRGYQVGLRYADECFIFGTSLQQRYSSNPELDGEIAVYVTIGLRNVTSFSTDPSFQGVGSYRTRPPAPPRI